MHNGTRSLRLQLSSAIAAGGNTTPTLQLLLSLILLRYWACEKEIETSRVPEHAVY
jgi:hypothetical protein